ncbi:hypothetical protein PIROE2DRAFT_54356 [Piromyces sp. E2]|nr:hypothetical protein PIROE2DRAFT_54356 [Piromyces sp. E2]|eukprot:OUM62666.1 hypothetical protein PIROE2DRAFT_54356 [Piromyces sp. E2]
MMMFQDEEENEDDDDSFPMKYPSSSTNIFKPSASIPIKKEKIEVIPAYIPSSIQNFSFYTSPLKHVQTMEEENYGERLLRTTYSRYQNEFEEITKLGKGGFGSVYQVRNKLDGQYYAIKKIKLQCDPQNTMECDIRIIQEVKTFARISNHPNIVRYHGAWIEALEITDSGSDDEFNDSDLSSPSKKLCSVLLIQMEFVSGKTLQAWLEERNTSSNPMVDRKIVIKIFKQIVQGLAHIHWNGFIHCDIKPANIFLQEDHHILIGDFGLAKKIVTDSSYLEQEDDELMGAGTYLYASPEQLSEHRCYDNKTDIYSLGILLFEMLCPFSTGMERVKTLMDIRQGKFSDKFIKTWPREFLLIKSLLHPDPMERPTALEILDSEILLNSYPLYDTTDLLVALDLHISPEQGYNKNNSELNHFSSNLNKKYNYQNNSNLPSISSLRSITPKNSMNEGKNNINSNTGNSSQGNIIPSTRCINQATSTAEINTVNASTYINSKCNQCQEKDLMISSYKIRCKNSEDTIKELKG